MRGCVRGPVKLVCCIFPAKIWGHGSTTYERKSAVSAGSYLRLVGVDEDLGMTQWATTTVTVHDTFLGPANGLFVNEFDSGHGLGLFNQSAI